VYTSGSRVGRTREVDARAKREIRPLDDLLVAKGVCNILSVLAEWFPETKVFPDNEIMRLQKSLETAIKPVIKARSSASRPST